MFLTRNALFVAGVRARFVGGFVIVERDVSHGNETDNGD